MRLSLSKSALMRKAFLILSLMAASLRLNAAAPVSIPWVTHGGAYTHEVGPQGWVQLTDANGGEAGAAWNPCTINISADFTLEFDINLGNRTCGADGMSFVLQSNGSAQNPGGNAGMQGYENINNSLSVAFDTYSNTLSPYNDPVYDSLDIRTNGLLQTATPLSCGGNGPTLTGSTCGRPQMLPGSTNAKDGASHHVIFTWTAATGTLGVNVDGSPRASYIFGSGYVSSIFNNNANVTYGWTATTGGSFNVQEFAQTSPNPGSCQATPTAVVWTPVPTVTNPCGSPTPIPSFTITPTFSPYQSPTITLTPTLSPTPYPAGCGTPVFQEAKVLASGCLGSTGTVTSASYSFTAQPNQLLVVRVITSSSSGAPSAVKFGSTAMSTFASNTEPTSNARLYTYYLASPPTTGTVNFSYANANCSWNIVTELYRNVDTASPVGGSTALVTGVAGASSPFPYSFTYTTSGPASLISVFMNADQAQCCPPTSTGSTLNMNLGSAGPSGIDGGGSEGAAGFYQSVGGPGTYTLNFDGTQGGRWWGAQPMEIRGNLSCGTPTFTATPSPTATGTNSPSPSFTATPTRTSTNSPSTTPTQTATSSVTSSRTPTYTSTGTNTMGPSPTSTSTPTATPTTTATSTQTSTRTNSPSPTATATDTSSSTITPSITVTVPFSATNTPSITQTCTQTPTYSMTVTFSSTATPTGSPSITLTPSATGTASATPTFSNTPSASDTPTESVTFSPTPTQSNTPTPSETATVTLTFTDSPTPSPSFTVSPTPVAAPHQVKVGVYNSAGELVRVIYNGAAQYQLGQLVLDRALVLGGVNKVHIAFPGYLMDPNGGTNTGGLDWAADNAAGQTVQSGVYTIKAEIIDPFGQITSLQQSVQVLDAEPENSLNIYNSAGERVAQVPLPAVGTGRFTSLSLPESTFGSQVDVASSTVAGPGFEIQLVDEKGVPASVYWNGVTSQGLPVSSGSYTAELIYSGGGATASRVVEAKGFVVIQAGAYASLEGAYAYPNPVTKDAPISIAYPVSTGSVALARLYALNGELVAQCEDRPGTGLLSFPPKRLAGGVYLIDVEKVNGAAVLVRTTLKVAVVH